LSVTPETSFSHLSKSRSDQRRQGLTFLTRNLRPPQQKSHVIVGAIAA
jgi:hypothetical protein